MDIVQFNKVSKSFLGQELFKNISLKITDKDKIGFIGLNGAGKSTLIKMILSKEKADEGDIFVNPNIKIAYLAQESSFFSDDNSVYEELREIFSYEFNLLLELEKASVKGDLSKIDEINNEIVAHNVYSIDYTINSILNGLELNNIKDRKISKLSGGEKTRLNLAKLLLQNPDLLILDEPTNHLDLVSIEWLEDFLIKYNKAFLVVSHDRIFLDNVCTKIFELENKNLETYKGNFSDYIIQKELIIKGKLKAFDKEQERIKKLEEYIERNRAGRMAKQAKGREKILNRIERLEDPIFNPKRMKLKLEVKNISGDNVLELKNVSKTFNGKNILKDISFKVYRGDRIGIIGKNGSGKSTLLKVIVGVNDKDKGDIIFGSNVKMAYYDQNQDNLSSQNTILQEINTDINYTEEYLRSIAGAFLFSKDDVDKKISSLSGGEKVRVSLIKIIQESPNLLILDEPTNHLDIYSIEVLEEALENYEGTLIVVSHNRHFLDSICNTIYVLEDENLRIFKGNYEEYKNSLKVKEEVSKSNEGKISYYENKEKNKKINSIKKRLSANENRLLEIDLEKKNLNESMYKPDIATNVEKLTDIQQKLEDLSSEEIKLIEESLNLEEELELLN